MLRPERRLVTAVGATILFALECTRAKRGKCGTGSGTLRGGSHVGTRDARSDGLASGRGRHEALRERVDEVEHAVCVEEGWTIEGERALAKICSLRREGDI